MHKSKRAAERYYTHVGPRFSCAYCDEPTECIDHATPAAWLQHHIHLTEDNTFFTVAACNDCNAKANKWFDMTFIERRARIARAVRKDSARLLATPRWCDSELDELGPLMRSEVVKAMRERERVKRRLRVLEGTGLPIGVPNEMLLPLRDGAEMSRHEQR